MLSEPIITVVLTVFKRTTYLEEAILSVLRQTFVSFEILVTDDANQPQTRTICEKFSSDGRVRYRTNPQTLGAPLNIAAAMRESRGKYIAILNDDDLLAPQALERLVAPLERKPEVVLVFGNYKIIDQAGHDLPKATALDMRARRRVGLASGVIENAFAFTLRRGVMAVFACVFRKTACNPAWLIAEVAGAYDYWLAIKISTQGAFCFVPETLMAWRQHADSVSTRISTDKFCSEVFIYRQLAGQKLDKESQAYVRSRLADSLYWRGREFLMQGWGSIETRAILRESLKTEMHFNVLAGWLLTFLPAAARTICLRAWRKIQVMRLASRAEANSGAND